MVIMTMQPQLPSRRSTIQHNPALVLVSFGLHCQCHPSQFLSSVQCQDGIYALGKTYTICTPSRLSEVSPALPSKQFQWLHGNVLFIWLTMAVLSKQFQWPPSNVHLTDDGHLLSFRGRLSSASSFHASLLQVIDDVMSLALCPQVVSHSQVSQHFRFSEKQATCEGCFVRQFLTGEVT